MKLGDFFQRAQRGQQVNPRLCSFFALGTDSGFIPIKVKVDAALMCVDEDTRETVRVQARNYLQKRFVGLDIPDHVFRDEVSYRMLFHALVEAEPDSNGIHKPLCESVDELRRSLIIGEMQKIAAEYEKYVAEEFPPTISDEDFAKLVDEAKKKFLPDLLIEYGYAHVQRLVSSLADLSIR